MRMRLISSMLGYKSIINGSMETVCMQPIQNSWRKKMENTSKLEAQ